MGHKVHNCAAFTGGNKYDGTFPGNTTGDLVPVLEQSVVDPRSGKEYAVESSCPFCGTSTSGMEAATSAQVRYLNGEPGAGPWRHGPAV